MYKRLTGLSFLLFFFFILVFPLFFFSDFFPSNIKNVIKEASLTVKVKLENSEFIIFRNQDILNEELKESSNTYKVLK